MVADAICHALEQNGLTCWIAPRDVRPGARYAAEIVRGIKDCRVMVLVYSRNSNQSEHVANEVDRAFNNSTTIIPFQVDNTPMNEEFTYYLARKHWLVAYPHYAEQLDNLAKAVANVLGVELKPLNNSLPLKDVANESKSHEELPHLKLKADIDCIFYLDGEKHCHLKAGIIQKFPLAPGEYELLFVSEENDGDRLEMEFEMPDVDKLQKVNLSDTRDSRLQKETEEKKRIAEERRLAEQKQREEEKRKAEQKQCEEEARAAVQVFTVGGVSFKMIRVEGGTFMMGSSDEDRKASTREKPQHQVTLSDYYIGETQVTQELWQTVMDNNPSYFNGGVNNPVEQVSWNDCQEFIRELNAKTGMNFQLPTEAQWEYAARGGKKSQGFKYAGSDNLRDVAWHGEKTHPVKKKKANELGLYDMSGNVWEWCQDRYGDYTSVAQVDPKGATSGSERVVRGGGLDFLADGMDCRSAYRERYLPSESFFFIGFRLALQSFQE